MKKLTVLVFAMCLILTSCAKQTQPSSSSVQVAPAQSTTSTTNTQSGMEFGIKVDNTETADLENDDLPTSNEVSNISGNSDEEITEGYVRQYGASFVLEEEDSHFASLVDPKTTWKDRKIQYPYEVEMLTDDILCSTIWEYNPTINKNILLVFYRNNKFYMGTVQSGVQFGGKYRFNFKNQIILYDFDNIIGDLEQYITPVDGEYVLNFYNTSNIIYSDLLMATNPDEYFGAVGSAPEEGALCKVGDLVVVREAWKAVTTGNPAFRTAPEIGDNTIQLDYVKMMLGDQMKPNVVTDFFIKGEYLDVLGRLETKSTVGGTKNYWYYVCYYSFDRVIYGWVFGSYLSEFDENKVDTYNQWRQTEVEKYRIK